MRRAFLKTAFTLLVLGLGLVLLIPSMFRVESVFHGNSGRIVLGVVVVGICLAIADRSISSLFRRARLTDERWSVFKSRGRP